MMMKLITFFLLCLMFPSFAEKAEKIDPKAQATRSFRDGLFWLKKQKYEKAQIKFKDAIEKQPKLAEAYNNYAYCTRMISDSDESYEEALKYYGAAIKLKPTLAVAYQYRGCLHFLMGNRDLAIADYRKLAKLDAKLAESLAEFINNDGVDPKTNWYPES